MNKTSMLIDALMVYKDEEISPQNGYPEFYELLHTLMACEELEEGRKSLLRLRNSVVTEMLNKRLCPVCGGNIYEMRTWRDHSINVSQECMSCQKEWGSLITGATS